MADNFKFVQAQPFSLAGAGAIIGDTTLTLKTFTGIDGALLTMTDFGMKGFGTISPGNGSLEESIVFTGVTQNANGTATLTGVKSVLFVAPYTQAANLLKTHAGSSPFIISNTSGFYNQLDSGENDETITGTWTFTVPNYPRMNLDTPFPTDNEQLATKAYIDSVAIAGAPDASNITKGITKLSVAPASPTNPIAVGDNDTRVPTQTEADALAGTSGTPSSTNKYVTNDDTSVTSAVSKVVRGTAGGKIDSSWLIGTSIIKFGGTGADGALTISSGTTTINLGAADVVTMNYTSISITGTGALNFSNPGANGTIIILKSQGNVTITSTANPAITTVGLGGPIGTKGVGMFIRTNPGSTITTVSPGLYNAVSVGDKAINLYAGAGGGNPSFTDVGSGSPGAGALYIECGGDFNKTSNITLAGTAGVSPAGTPGFNNSGTGGSGGGSLTDGAGASQWFGANTYGGGGGGGGGVFVVLYNGTLISNTGTATITGGAGGLFGGAGGNGYSLVTANTEFA